MTNTKAPIMVIRDGPLKASIWENHGENGSFLTAKFAKTYTKDGQPKDGHSFGRNDLLPLSELIRKVYHKTIPQRRKDTQPEASPAQSGAEVADVATQSIDV